MRNLVHHPSLDQIADATLGTEFEAQIFVVGGAVRDALLGRPHQQDFDLVLEGDALALADHLNAKGLSSHHPVTYPRFGTAMLTIEGAQIELVTARAERYDPAHRKPEVWRATLKDDAFRRDFTINTLMENLHTGELIDFTGKGRTDMDRRILRTPLDPEVTFYDDPLRMLRAVRFSVQLGFEIADDTWKAVLAGANRLDLVNTPNPVVSAERIRDEWTKILLSNDPSRGIIMMRESGILAMNWPELLEMVGVEQNDWHQFDVWDHTLEALNHLVRHSTPLDSPQDELADRLGILLHDCAKPRTRTVDEKGIHFYEHERVGAQLTVTLLRRLKFPLDLIDRVNDLVRLHMRLGQMQPEWKDAAVRRLIRETHAYHDSLVRITRADMAAMSATAPVTDMNWVCRRIQDVNQEMNAVLIDSPLDGAEIMTLLGVSPGREVGQAKAYLLDQVIEGNLAPCDKAGAIKQLKRWRLEQLTAS